MDKLKTRILLISLLLVLLFSAQAVTAATDNDGNLTSENIDLSICDNTDNVKLSNNPDDILSASNELDVLGAGEATYSNLSDEISRGRNVELQYDYYRCTGGESTITIYGNNRVIDGKGAVIDMAGLTIRAFHVTGSGVTIKNLTIKNANFNGNGGAIYFSKSGTVENCNFTNNSASDGGAIKMDSGNVTNCNFINNNATGTVSRGGAVYFNREGTVSNCNFTNNKATGDSSYGGAIRMSSGTVTNCNFTGNTATYDGGAVYFLNTGTVSN